MRVIRLAVSGFIQRVTMRVCRAIDVHACTVLEDKFVDIESCPGNFDWKGSSF